MDWTGYLHYKAKHTDIDSELSALFVSVSAFSVVGGAKRFIDLTSTDDISLVSELEQARTFRNLTLYLPPATNFEWLDLTEIAIHKLSVSIKLILFGQNKSTTVQSFVLAIKGARISERPLKRTNGGKPVLEVKLTFSDVKLFHGTHEGGGIKDEEW